MLLFCPQSHGIKHELSIDDSITDDAANTQQIQKGQNICKYTLRRQNPFLTAPQIYLSPRRPNVRFIKAPLLYKCKEINTDSSLHQVVY